MGFSAVKKKQTNTKEERKEGEIKKKKKEGRRKQKKIQVHSGEALGRLTGGDSKNLSLYQTLRINKWRQCLQPETSTPPEPSPARLGR